MPNPLEFGIVITDEDGRIERFLEKPHWGQVFSDTINTGIYVLEPEIFDHIPEASRPTSPSDVFPKLLDKGAPLFGFVADGYWKDVGNLEAYQQRPPGRPRRPGQRRHARVRGPARDLAGGGGRDRPGRRPRRSRCSSASTAKVEAGRPPARVHRVGSSVIVKRGAFLHRAIVHDNAYIGPGASLRGCVVGRNADVKRGGPGRGGRGRRRRLPTSAHDAIINLM